MLCARNDASKSMLGRQGSGRRLGELKYGEVLVGSCCGLVNSVLSGWFLRLVWFELNFVELNEVMTGECFRLFDEN